MKNIAKFLELYGSNIVDGCLNTGLFPSVLMAQIIQESSGNNEPFGLSGLAFKYNNFGGIKAWAGYTGRTATLPTKEYVNGKYVTVNAKFCHFDNVKDFVKWRTVFLKRNSRYEKAGVFSASSPADQCRALQKAGYATDPQYSNNLIRVISQNGLLKLDDELKKK